MNSEIKDFDIQKQSENEFTPLNVKNISNVKIKKDYNLYILFILIIFMLIIALCQYRINYKNDILLQDRNNIYHKNIIADNIITNINIEDNQNQKNNDIININQNDEKIGVAFIYHILHSNGVARVVSLTADYLIKTGRYNVYLITGKTHAKDFKFDSRIKRFKGHNNRTIIKSLKQSLNIKYFILNNQLTKSLIQFLQSLDAKVIGIFHGVYLSAIFHNNTQAYRGWYKFDYYDAFITVAADDLYFYKKLGFTQATFLPNLYTFEPSETPVSNLTYNNIVILGRAHDKIKGIIYAIKAMTYIVKEVPDTKLILASSDSNVKNIQKLINEYNLSKNIEFKFFPNITEIFLNSSVLMFTSLCEAFPMAMNEGKAHGLPVVAFNIPFSPPYQSGVITVPHLDVEALANETIKLLKNYNYRKQKGIEAKLSLNRFSNKNTVKLWEKLFDSLKNRKYRDFQKEIEEKFYDEQIAREHVLMHFNSALKFNKYFRCHTFENMLNIKYIKNIKNCTNVT